MAILAPENGGTRKLLPPDPVPISLTQAQINKRNADALRRSKALKWARAANVRRVQFDAGGLTGATAGGAGKNTTPVRPAAIPKPTAFFPPPAPAPPSPAPPPASPPPSIPPPIAKIPQLPALPPLPPPPLPPPLAPSVPTPPGTAAGGGGAAGGGILLILGLALLASFGKR